MSFLPFLGLASFGAGLVSKPKKTPISDLSEDERFFNKVVGSRIAKIHWCSNTYFIPEELQNGSFMSGTLYSEGEIKRASFHVLTGFTKKYPYGLGWKWYETPIEKLIKNQHKSTFRKILFSKYLDKINRCKKTGEITIKE